MQLARPASPQRLISLVSMIDVLLIMLVFFMVTSTYLNLDMIPMAQQTSDGAVSTTNPEHTTPLLIRLGGDGQPYLRGQPVSFAALAQRVQSAPQTPITILPALRASTQSLVSLMDTLTGAGAGQLRILQVAAP
ncbi:MAG: biopolymer transporter ExbD [Sulfitobacter sp.]